MNTLVRSLPQFRKPAIVSGYIALLALLGTICMMLAHQIFQQLPGVVEYALRDSCDNGICASSDLSGDALFITLLTVGALAMTFAWLVIGMIEHLYNEHLRRPENDTLDLISPFIQPYGWCMFVFALLVGLTVAYA